MIITRNTVSFDNRKSSVQTLRIFTARVLEDSGRNKVRVPTEIQKHNSMIFP